MNILKYLKVVGIILGIGICQLKSFPYNVITMTRDVDSVSYNRLAEEEIYLVFAQLACRLSSNDSEIRNVLECYKSGLSSKLEKTDIASVKNVNIPTIIVFNEAFFGQDQPLERKEVDQIIEIYKKFMHFLPNAYLYVNFLYTDIQIQGCASQIDISKKRYIEISDMEFEKSFEEFAYPSFLFDDRIEELSDYTEKIYLEEEIQYLKDCSKNFKENSEFLFNQTKIFYNGEEIGYYNKSSFCKELGAIDITGKNVYYIIGDFSTIYKQTPPPIPVFCLTCYDIDVITNECYLAKMPKDKICIFASNTSGSLLSVINVFEEKSLPRFFIWADPHGKCLDPNDENLNEVCLSNVLECENGKFIKSKAITQHGEVLFDFPIALIPTYPEAKNSFKLSVFELTEQYYCKNLRP